MLADVLTSTHITKDVDFVSGIINNPDILPWVSLPNQGRLDVSPLMEDGVVVALDGGCFIFALHNDGVYEVHSQVLKESRGKTLQASKEAVARMFFSTECMEIITKVPTNNAPAKGLTLANGFEHRFTRKSWPTKDGLIDCEYFSLGIDRWVGMHEIPLKLGQWFHEKLEEEKQKHGRTENHEDEEIHNRYVGASLGMAMSGCPHKGEWFYNKWARFAGYETVEVLGVDPLVIDIREAIVQIDDNLRILKCR